jgi:hypothetical protein
VLRCASWWKIAASAYVCCECADAESTGRPSYKARRSCDPYRKYTLMGSWMVPAARLLGNLLPRGALTTWSCGSDASESKVRRRLLVRCKWDTSNI